MRAPLSKVRLEHLSRLGERRWNSRISAHVRFNTTTVSLSDEGSGAGGSGKMEGLAPRFFSFIHSQNPCFFARATFHNTLYFPAFLHMYPLPNPPKKCRNRPNF